jgi:hypothetical protein
MNDSWLVQATTWVLTSWKIYTIAEWGAKGVFQISTKDCPQFQKIWWWANQICPAPNRNKKRTLGVPTTNWYESQLNNAKGEEERWNSSFSSYMYFHCSYLYSCYNSSGTLCIKCWVSYWVLIKLPYFADTTERGVRGWKEAQRQGEDWIWRISLICYTNYLWNCSHESPTNWNCSIKIAPVQDSKPSEEIKNEKTHHQQPCKQNPKLNMKLRIQQIYKYNIHIGCNIFCWKLSLVENCLFQ